MQFIEVKPTSNPTFATMQRVSVKVINKSSHTLPQYATIGSSGVDVRANLTEILVLQPLQREAVPTGLFVEIPIGYEAQIRSRSGLALKQGLMCLNSPGTIDSDYRGEIKVIIANLSNQPVTINNGDRIAQMVFAPISLANFYEVVELKETQRGEGGFGHTGIK